MQEITEIKVGATALYDASDYWGDSIILGVVGLLNAFLPLVIWTTIIGPAYEKMNSNKVFLYAWYGMQASHLMAYSIPALLWPFIYIKSMSFARALFAYTWTYLGQGLGLCAASYTTITLLAASYLYTKFGERDDEGEPLLKLTDIWST